METLGAPALATVGARDCTLTMALHSSCMLAASSTKAGRGRPSVAVLGRSILGVPAQLFAGVTSPDLNDLDDRDFSRRKISRL